jgi:hypothetical protein
LFTGADAVGGAAVGVVADGVAAAAGTDVVGAAGFALPVLPAGGATGDGDADTGFDDSDWMFGNSGGTASVVVPSGPPGVATIVSGASLRDFLPIIVETPPNS